MSMERMMKGSEEEGNQKQEQVEGMAGMAIAIGKALLLGYKDKRSEQKEESNQSSYD